MTTTWEPFSNEGFEILNQNLVSSKVPSKTPPKEILKPMYNIVAKIEDTIDNALEALYTTLDITSHCNFTPNNIIALVLALGGTATQSLGECLTL